MGIYSLGLIQGNHIRVPTATAKNLTLNPKSPTEIHVLLSRERGKAAALARTSAATHTSGGFTLNPKT